jgi:hypothetical protein
MSTRNNLAQHLSWLQREKPFVPPPPKQSRLSNAILPPVEIPPSVGPSLATQSLASQRTVAPSVPERLGGSGEDVDMARIQLGSAPRPRRNLVSRSDSSGVAPSVAPQPFPTPGATNETPRTPAVGSYATSGTGSRTAGVSTNNGIDKHSRYSISHYFTCSSFVRPTHTRPKHCEPRHTSHARNDVCGHD